MNKDTPTIGIAQRQAALVNLILTLYNVIAMMPSAHRFYGRNVVSFQTALLECVRQRVPLSWANLERDIVDLVQWARDTGTATTWRAVFRHNLYPNRRTASVNRRINHALVEYIVNFSDLDIHHERRLRHILWPLAFAGALKVLRTQRESFSSEALHLVWSLFSVQECNHIAQLTAGE